jgi:WD40 repeat protein
MVYDTYSGYKLRQIQVAIGNIYGLKFLNEDILAIGEGATSGKYYVSLYEWNNDVVTKIPCTLCHTNVIKSIDVISSTQFITASSDTTIKIWSYGSSPALVRTLTGHTAGVNTVNSISTSTSVSGSSDNNVKVWRNSNGACLATLIGHTDDVLSVVGLPFNYLASGSKDGTIRVN